MVVDDKVEDVVVVKVLEVEDTVVEDVEYVEEDEEEVL